MTNRPRVRKDLVIIASLVAFVSEEMDRLVFNARDFLLTLDMPQTIGLVPAGREDVEGDLAADRKPVEEYTVRWDARERRIRTNRLQHQKKKTYVRP